MRRKLFIAMSIVGILAIATALSSTVPLILHERSLAQDLRQFAKGGRALQMNDDELRRETQALARKRGFHLPLPDVYVQLQADKNQTFETTRRLGYTLFLNLPVLFSWRAPVVAVRVFDVH